MPDNYNIHDPRFRPIRNGLRGLQALDLDGLTPHHPARQKHVKTTYRTSDLADRDGQSDQKTYHNAIQLAGQGLLPAPKAVVYQTNTTLEIKVTEVEGKLDQQPCAFIHYSKFPTAKAKTRLYIPCHLAHADKFISRLWTVPGLKSVKIVGYGNATDRPDVMVAYFLAQTHAKAIGQQLDIMYPGELSGTFPIGAFSCSSANKCGWAPEFGNGRSVGTDAMFDLTYGGGTMSQVSPSSEAPF